MKTSLLKSIFIFIFIQANLICDAKFFAGNYGLLEISTEDQSELGNYQIQVVNSRNMPNIPANIDEIVRTNRKQSEIVYLKLDNSIRIKILSLDEISKSDFQPLPQIAHIEE